MTERGIECRPGIQPIHREPAYAERHANEHLPETLRAARRSFFLPLYPAMTDEEQDFVIRSLREALHDCAARKEAR
jgi:dTDP-4-amino-4,6-dideoxygalactose transaminase